MPSNPSGHIEAGASPTFHSSWPTDAREIYDDRRRPYAPPSPSSNAFFPSQTYQYAAPIQATTSQARGGSSTGLFHPYQPKPRPLLFVNTIPPPSSTPEGSAQLSPDAGFHLKPKRKRITPEQLSALTAMFEKTESPSFDVRESLGAHVSMTNREVQVWFQNRRAKMNRLKAQGGAADKDKPLPAPPTVDMDAASVSPQLAEGPVEQSPPSNAAALRVHVQQESYTTSFRLPSAAEVSPATSEGSPSADWRNRRPRPRPLTLHEIPKRVSFVSAAAQETRSLQRAASVPLLSPYLALTSPPLSGQRTSALPSPAFSSSSSSYFSSTDVTSPYTPSSVSSPGSTSFFRLSLDSPGSLASPQMDTSKFASEFEFIKLPPLLPPSHWNNQRAPHVAGRAGRGHQRSESDSKVLKDKLPSLRAVVDGPLSPSFANGIPSPASQEGPAAVELTDELSAAAFHPAPPSRPSFGASRRSWRLSPSSLITTLPSTEEEDTGAAPPVIVSEAPMGLGMLAIAASELDESDLKKEGLYSETRRMSYSS